MSKPAIKLTPFTAKADKLGELRAQIRLLQDSAKVIEAELKADGQPVYEGLHFRVTVSCSDRATINWRAVAERLEPSHQLVSAHTSHKEVCTVRVSAHRKG